MVLPVLVLSLRLHQELMRIGLDSKIEIRVHLPRKLSDPPEVMAAMRPWMDEQQLLLAWNQS